MSTPLYRADIVSASVENVLRAYRIVESPTGSGFRVEENVIGAHVAVDVQEGFSPRGNPLSSPYTDDNVPFVNELNTFTGLARIRVASRDFHPDSAMGMAHVSYMGAYNAFKDSSDFVIFLTVDMFDQLGSTDAQVFTQLGLNTGLTIQRVRNGLLAMPGQVLPVWRGEHCGMSLFDSFFHRDLKIGGFTDVVCKGTYWQAPWEENFSVLKSAAARIEVATNGGIPYIVGSSTGCHELLTRRAVSFGYNRVVVAIVSGDDSEYCDKATVLDLIALGYTVIVAYEAMAPLSPDDEAIAFREMQDAGAIFASNEVLRQANVIYSGLVPA